MQFTKKSYTTPKFITHGDVEVITKGSQNGNNLDATFPAGTPRGQLTFS